MPMILSNTSKIKYKFDTNGRNTVQMAKLLKEYRVSGFLISVNDRTITMRVPREDIKMNRKIKEWLRMKIKRKVEMNLPQLLEWVWENGITNKEYICNEFKKKSVIFNLSGWAEFSDEFSYNPDDTFTVEVEEEITEDTVIPKLVVNHRDTGFTIYENDYINNEFPLDSVQAFYILNTDKTMTLIWRDGKLVE